jgi:hypothetical protein
LARALFMLRLENRQKMQIAVATFMRKGA